MCVLRCVLLVCLALVHSDPIHESGHKHGHKVPSVSFKWTSKFSMGLKLPDGREDEISLRHADTGGGVAVPCLFEGTLENDANGHVAVLGCRDGDNTQVTLVSKYSNSTMFNVEGNNGTREILDPYRVTDNTDEGLMETDEDQRDKRSTYPEDYDEDYIEFSGASLDPVPQHLVYEIAVAYDETFLDKFGGNKLAAEQYIVAVMTHTQPYLLDGSLETHIYLHIQHKPIFLQGKRLQVFDANLQSMEEAKRIASSVPLAIFTFSDDSDRYMGVAVRRQGCDPTLARIILKWRCDIQKIAKTCSHEIAHLLGNFHDAREDVKKTLDGVTFPCEGKGLMSETVSIKERPATFSECSKKRLQVWFNTYGSCLTEGVECSDDSNSWDPPCLCGTGSTGRSLCTGKHTCCEAATGTCIGFKNLDDVLAEMSWMKSQVMKLTKQMELHHPPLSPQTTALTPPPLPQQTTTPTPPPLPPQTTTPAPTPLPAQASVCLGYTALTNLWRHIDYNNRGEFPPHCDKTGSSSGYHTNLSWGSWYRFTGAAGTKLPTAPAPVGGGPDYANRMCGTNAVAYISSGDNPTIQDGIVTRDVCFEWQSDSCHGKTTIGVAACRDIHGDYFVYQLQPVPYCANAYCAID